MPLRVAYMIQKALSLLLERYNTAKIYLSQINEITYPHDD